MRRTLIAVIASAGAALVGALAMTESASAAGPATIERPAAVALPATADLPVAVDDSPVAGPAAAGAGTSLTLTIRPATGRPKVATLTCAPAGGSHANAARACATLTAAGGNPNAIRPIDGVCTMQYDPVVASVTGRWEGRAVQYRKTFSNACAMRLATGPLFNM